MGENIVFEQKKIDAENACDYTQSANSLFHFMKEYRFLEEVLTKKAMLPRFYVEDITYLNLNMMGQPFKEIAVLQKCFCDIPFHQISNISKVDVFDKEKKERKENKTQYYCHTDLYGEYGIAFSKKWAESHNVQPVHYINENTEFCHNFSQALEMAFEAEELDDKIAYSFLQRLAFMKPLKGWMPVRDGYIYKNFHDECEWRYVPKDGQGGKDEIDPVIANPSTCVDSGHLDWMNMSLKQEVYEKLWLHYDYDDITYVIVPDNLARQQLIDCIIKLPVSNFRDFGDASSVQRQKLTLISKIIVLSQITKDF